MLHSLGLHSSLPRKSAVEAEARQRGFYIGKVGHGENGTNSYSIYVYLRDLDTIE